MNDGITTERFTLNLERCLTRCRIPRESLRVFVADDVLTGQLVAEFEARVLTDKFAEDSYSSTTHVATSPLQVWKRKHDQAWWLRWFVVLRPVRMKPVTLTVRLARMHAYPFARVPAEQFGRPVVVERLVGGELWRGIDG
ncbi:MAG: hypothetical protein A2135_08665 [Actinobacteria bacterium RBG_16_67_15]|nr:MAG: hypothetical protein A2135_08665 [Actinobacteria bacterium RBG_16_67_15]